MRTDDPANRDIIFQKLKSRFLKYIDHDLSQKSVLDFGSGPRGYILQWAEMFKDVFATDLRDFSANYAGTGIKFIPSDGLTVSLPDQSVDVIVSHSVIEHVSDIPGVLGDMNRMLRIWGKIYITVSPLYYSSTGLHNKQKGINNWEHLDPNHQAYLSPTPFFAKRTQAQIEGREPDVSGSLLNKMRVSDFLSAVGGQPWQIDFFGRDILTREIPEYVDVKKYSPVDLLTKGMTFIGTKICELPIVK